MNMQKRLFLLLRVLLLTIICCMQMNGLMAQGRTIPRSSEIEEGDTSLPEFLPEGQKYRYSLLNGLNISVDISDPIMNLFYYDHASYEAQVMVDLHHRFFPMAAFGMGYADETSNNGNDYGTDGKQEITFVSDMAPFAKVGIAYNLDYNSLHPSDLYLLFLRYGYAYNKADIKNLYYADELWGACGPISICNQKYQTHWLELGLMLKVQLMRHVSLGWDLYWKVPLMQTGTDFGKPTFVPGYGLNSSSIGFSFRFYYDIF